MSDIDLTKVEALRLQSAYLLQRQANAVLNSLLTELCAKYEINIDDYEAILDQGIFTNKNGDKK